MLTRGDESFLDDYPSGILSASQRQFDRLLLISVSRQSLNPS
jgi:hypothetical protein